MLLVHALCMWITILWGRTREPIYARSLSNSLILLFLASLIFLVAFHGLIILIDGFDISSVSALVRCSFKCRLTTSYINTSISARFNAVLRSHDRPFASSFLVSFFFKPLCLQQLNLLHFEISPFYYIENGLMNLKFNQLIHWLSFFSYIDLFIMIIR